MSAKNECNTQITKGIAFVGFAKAEIAPVLIMILLCQVDFFGSLNTKLLCMLLQYSNSIRGVYCLKCIGMRDHQPRFILSCFFILYKIGGNHFGMTKELSW